VIHVYAFTRSGAPLPSIAGITGAELETYVVDGIAAVCSHVVESAAGREAVIAHGFVVEALREVTDAVLPVRFGERFADAGALRDAIRERAALLRDDLARVEGCVEFGVRLIAERSHVPAAADGRAYMQALVAANAVAAELHRPLAGHARATVTAAGTAAYLVPADERDAFERDLAAFVESHPDVTVVCTGPWAPYSFAEAA
jgi:Gas vesicle synthesis protein GvpL/GvpF